MGFSSTACQHLCQGVNTRVSLIRVKKTYIGHILASGRRDGEVQASTPQEAMSLFAHLLRLRGRTCLIEIDRLRSDSSSVAGYLRDPATDRVWRVSSETHNPFAISG